jgi:hypothetical protein
VRFMMLMIPKGYESADPSVRPSAEGVAEMMTYNKEMLDSGVMLSGEGLHPPSAGARVSFSGGKPTIKDGPFAEAKELIGGFWIIQVGSRQEAVDWAARCPAGDGDIIEIRQIFEMEDFPPDVQEAARI